MLSRAKNAGGAVENLARRVQLPNHLTTRTLKTITMLMSEQTINTTRISAVAVIADRTAYNVRYTGKLSNRFRLQVDKRLVYARSDTTGIMNAPKPYPLKRD